MCFVTGFPNGGVLYVPAVASHTGGKALPSFRMNPDMASSSRRVVIITGAAQGIGRAVGLRLAKDGFDLGLFDLLKCRDLLEEVAASARTEFGARVVTVYGDVSVEEDVKGLVTSVVQELGDLYAVSANVYIAGVPPYSTPGACVLVLDDSQRGHLCCVSPAREYVAGETQAVSINLITIV